MTEQKIQSQHIEGKNGSGYVVLFYQPATQTGIHEGYEVVQGYTTAKRKMFKAYWYSNKEKAIKGYDKAVKNITTKLA